MKALLLMVLTGGGFMVGFTEGNNWIRVPFLMLGSMCLGILGTKANRWFEFNDKLKQKETK